MSIGSLERVSIGLIAVDVVGAISRAVSMAVTVVAVTVTVTVMAVTVAVARARAIVASLNGCSESGESKGFEHSRYKILFFILKAQLYLLYS